MNRALWMYATTQRVVGHVVASVMVPAALFHGWCCTNRPMSQQAIPMQHVRTSEKELWPERDSGDTKT